MRTRDIDRFGDVATLKASTFHTLRSNTHFWCFFLSLARINHEAWTALCIESVKGLSRESALLWRAL